MKKTVFSFLMAMALCLLAGIPVQARGPVLDPDAIRNPRLTSSLMCNSFYFTSGTASEVQTTNLSALLLNRSYKLAAGDVKNTSETVLRSTVNTFDVPFINYFFAEEGWRSGAYATSSNEELHSRTQIR